MEEDKNIRDELNEISPLLNKLKKPPQEQWGGPPEGYFNSFESRLMEKLATEGEAKKETKIVAIAATPARKGLRPAYIMGIAASFLVLVLGGIWWLRGQQNNPFDYTQLANMDIEKSMNAIALQDADDYLLAHIDELETEDLLAGVDEESLEQLSNAQATSALGDTLPPAPKLTPTPNEPSQLPNAEGGLKEELEEDIADDTDLDDILGGLEDDDLEALEAALLGPKAKKEPKEPTKPKTIPEKKHSNH